MTQQTNPVVPTQEEVKEARAVAIQHFRSMTNEQLSLVVSATPVGGKPEGVTDLEFCVLMVTQMPDDEVVQFAANLKAFLVMKEEQEEEVQVVQDNSVLGSTWVANVIDKMTSLNKHVYVSYLRVEAMREKDGKEKNRILEVIADLEDPESKSWEKMHRPHLRRVKGWQDIAPGSAAEMAAKAGLKTQRGVSKATNWTGRQLVKMGKSMQRHSEMTGKVVASPLFGAASLLSKDPSKKQAPKKKEKPAEA